jgi:hypothetical protein
MGAVRHQFVIGRVKLDLIPPVAPGIEDAQFRRIFIGEPPAFGHGGRAPVPAEFG